MLNPSPFFLRLALTAGLGCVLAASLGCVQTVKGQVHPALRERSEPVRRVAVAPFVVGERLRGGGSAVADGPAPISKTQTVPTEVAKTQTVPATPSAGSSAPTGRASAQPSGLPTPSRAETSTGLSPDLAAQLLAAQFAQRLRERGVDVIPAPDVARALEAAGIRGRLIPRQVAALVREKFGADALLMGQLNRLAEREGGGAGATRGATIGFQADLFDTPGAARLWTGNVDETQRPLSENVLDAYRYPGGGSRWLTAEELLAWGAKQTTLQIPLY